VLAQRIALRGREAGDGIAARLARRVDPFPAGVEVARVLNDASADLGIEHLVAALEAAASRLSLRRMPVHAGREHIAYLPAGGTPVSAFGYGGRGNVEVLAGTASVRARVHVLDFPELLGNGEIGLSQEAFTELGLPEGSEVTIRRTPSPESRRALTDKIRGEELDESQYDLLVRDIIEGRYPDGEVAAFLVAATQKLSDAEVLALARVRTRYAEPIRWNEKIVVDKHSMGGIPGSRITLIVVPIIAAHGLAMPKTSSRAITSAAGTADAMETVARVDLTPDQVRHTVMQARACIAWNGRLNHSVVDDVMNAITRPLGIDSNRWSVASILSKKLTAGSTHVIVDLPFGPRAKLKTEAQANELAALFESVGAGLGLTVRAFATDGSGPIGRGIGPALEVRDVGWVLDSHPDAPADLREKALFFASQILAWDPAVGSVEEGRRIAETLLRSGAARTAFERIVDAQGRRDKPVLPSALVHTVSSRRAGVISGIDGWVIAGIARRAGAPLDKGAGIDLLCPIGSLVEVGDPLFRIHAATQTDLEAATELAEHDNGYGYALSAVAHRA